MDNIKEAWKVFTDVWAFYKKFFEVSHTDEYWEKVINEADRLYKENPTPLKRALINAVEGNVEDALLFCGSNAYRSTKIETVSEVMKELCGEV